MASALIAIWRDRRHEAARERDLLAFTALIEEMPLDDLERLRSDYATLAAFDPNQQFRRKRDACAAEIERRSRADSPLPDAGEKRRPVSLWDA